MRSFVATKPRASTSRKQFEHAEQELLGYLVLSYVRVNTARQVAGWHVSALVPFLWKLHMGDIVAGISRTEIARREAMDCKIKLLSSLDALLPSACITCHMVHAVTYCLRLDMQAQLHREDHRTHLG